MTFFITLPQLPEFSVTHLSGSLWNTVIVTLHDYVITKFNKMFSLLVYQLLTLSAVHGMIQGKPRVFHDQGPLSSNGGPLFTGCLGGTNGPLSLTQGSFGKLEIYNISTLMDLQIYNAATRLHV